ncbi:MAG TPA: sigma-54 dependent transcriptional regulator [Thermoanaerobaculaceae bacterium]|nr:sigma-54 dependent transcriptional regulator [Thermoanaerobaculaceae bacterium]HRS15673.1 sigma-54 dependent transcriptional regulator [Thermoanaerobaculaceae bacterium]
MGEAGRVLVVDDNAANRLVVKTILTGAGFEVSEAADAFAALDRIDREQPHAVLLDIKMPGMDGLGLLANLRSRGVDVPVIVLTGHGDEFTAASCLEAGADAFLDKPPERATLLLTVQGAVRRGRLAEENRRLRGAGQEEPPLLGSSAVMAELREGIARVAPSRATVLVVGESGTGKELVARRIHHLSPRARQAFVRVNCAAIPEELIESELFGHEKGAFTGAVRRQVGKFVQADGGTIFLDEVGDMSLRTQAKVLRVLQDGEVEPVGAGTVGHVDVRVIAATNKDLQEEVKAGRFREDLFFRLSVVVLRTPPLRTHPDDIPSLVEHFTRLACEEYSRRPKRWSAEALRQLAAYPFPGNVRELKNIVERAVIMQLEDEIHRVDLLPGAPTVTQGDEGVFTAATLTEFQEQAERAYLVRQLQRHGWNVAATARAIQTPRSNLYKKIEAYGLKRED